MKTFIFGFGWEIMGFVLYALAWGWLCELLERKVAFLNKRIVLVGACSVLMLHPFVANYLVLLFWLLITITGIVLWIPSTGKMIRSKLSWVSGFNSHAIRLVILVIAFIIFRHFMFQDYPNKVWY